MAIALDPTVGGASSNSLGSLDEATAYFEGRLGSAPWTAADPDTQTIALITAARSLNAQLYRGAKASAEQAMPFPRVGIYEGGQAIPSTIVPRFAKEAQFEEAFSLLVASQNNSANPLAATGLEPFSALAVGDINLTMRDPGTDDASRNLLSPQAYRLLRAYLITDLVSQPPSGTRNVRLVRGG